MNGTRVRFAWLTRPVPVLLAAYGPRVLELAGAEADGLILQLASPKRGGVGGRPRAPGGGRGRPTR